MATGARTRNRTVIAALAAAVVVADWMTKTVAAVVLDDRAIHLGSVVTLRLGHNPGVAFGLGNRLPAVVVLGVTAIVTVVAAVAAARGALEPPAAAGLVLGGAFANLGDRLIGGTVVDFFDLGWWPSFNLADVAITVGVVVMLLASLRPDATTG